MSGRVRPPCLPRREQHQGWTASRPGAWPTRASSLSLSTTSCGSRFSSRASATTPCLLPKNLSQLDPMVCLHVLVRPPTGWLVRSYHRARCVHDVLHRCHSPDVGRARGAPASVIQEPHAAAAHQNSLVVRRYRHLPRDIDIDIDIDERHQPCHWSHVPIIAVRTRRARRAGERSPLTVIDLGATIAPCTVDCSGDFGGPLVTWKTRWGADRGRFRGCAAVVSRLRAERG